MAAIPASGAGAHPWQTAPQSFRSRRLRGRTRSDERFVEQAIHGGARAAHEAAVRRNQAMKLNGVIPWIKDERDPNLRDWEEFYRNRWQHDKVVRSTHGVNCTGACTWQIYVKDGIVTWEMQGLDYPSLEAGLPPYEPRGCQRGISFSWYLYSPLRVKYPYARGALLDLWKQARTEHEDPVDAWKSLVENPEKRQRWQRARGKGG